MTGWLISDAITQARELLNDPVPSGSGLTLSSTATNRTVGGCIDEARLLLNDPAGSVAAGVNVTLSALRSTRNIGAVILEARGLLLKSEKRNILIDCGNGGDFIKKYGEKLGGKFAEMYAVDKNGPNLISSLNSFGLNAHKNLV